MATVVLASSFEGARQRKFGKSEVTLGTGAGTASDIIDKRGYGSIGVRLPTLTSTTLTIEVCEDETTANFVDLYNSSNTQISFASETGGKYIDIPELASANYFRFKSSANQASSRTLVVIGHV